MKLKRRELLLGSATVAASSLLERAAGALADTARPSQLAGAQVIWCSSAVAVPLRTGGRAERIASSSDGRQPAVPDFHCVFAKELYLRGAPSSAVLHLFAFTRYRLYVNGDYVGRGPARYQNQRPEYDSRSLTGRLKSGRNTVVVLVHRDAPTGRIMLHEAGFVASLEMQVKGRRQVIATDTSWHAMPELSFGLRTEAWSSIPEHVDARRTTAWTLPDLSSPSWSPAIVVPASDAKLLVPRSTPMQSEVQLPLSADTAAFPLNLIAGSEVTLRLPQIVQAFHQLVMDADEGSALEVSYELPGGEVSGECTYVGRSGEQTWMGGDSFAFRQLRVRVTAGRIRITEATAYEVRYPFERAASFSCSDPELTQLWSVCARSLEVLSEDAYVDCADRERVEWTDCSPPAFDCTRVMMRGPDDVGTQHWGDARLLRGLLQRIALTQQPDGQLKAHSCSERFDIHAIMEDRTCGWVVLLREYVESTGDKMLLRELWPTLMRLLAWYTRRLTPRGLVLAREWEVWDNPLRYQECEGAGLNAMVYRAFADAVALARSIGRQIDEQTLTAATRQLGTAFNRHLWNEQEGAYDGALFGPGSKLVRDFTGPLLNGHYAPTGQANLFALYAGVVPPERVARVRSWILNHLNEVREPMSHYYLFRMLYEMQSDEADAQVLALTRTGWKNQVDSEWQTSWEDLENSKGSKVHVYGMHPGHFLTAYVLGARREGAADQRSIVIEPRMSGLAWAKGICVTEFGPVEVDWQMNDAKELEGSCTVPVSVHARLRLRVNGGQGSLRVDGRVATRRDGDFLEAPLSGGRHTIRFTLSAG